VTGPEPAELDVVPPRRSLWRNLSFVWLVPLAALAVSLALAWQTYANRGVQITISFLDGGGIAAGETTIRYRDVVVGTVESLSFTPDLSRVLVHARVNPDVAPFMDEDAQFWVVRPEVSARGITGLTTVLSGVYIAGAWDQTPGTPRRVFTGSDGPVLHQPGREGSRITLRSLGDVSLVEGAPVYFRGIEVGRLEQPRLTVSTDAVVVDAFIEAPHDRRLTTATRFWDTSGFSLSIGTTGVSLDFNSLTSLVIGGISFDAVFEGGERVGPGYVFDIYEDEGEARRSLFALSTAGAVKVSVRFDESISGLAPGSEVRYGGITVGQVEALSAVVTPGETQPEIVLIANIAILPNRLGLPSDAAEEDVLDFLEQAVEGGLRARLASASFLTGGLQIELAQVEDAEPAVFERDAEPLPRLPSMPSDLPDITATAEGLLERLNALPIEDLMMQATSLLAGVDDLVRSESTRAVPDEVAALLGDLRALVNDAGTQALPGELRGAVEDLRAVVAELRESGAMEGLASALTRAEAAADSIAEAAGGVPDLIEDLRAVAAKANSLEAEELIAAATRVLDSADAVIGTDAARALPPTLTGALDQVRLMVSELREGGTVEGANETMASARAAADAVAEAAAGLPDLATRLEQLVTQAEGVIASYGARSDFNQETLAALREVRNAARSFAQLARTIERNPSSLILGR
jgi:paraquat-inducible protein B